MSKTCQNKWRVVDVLETHAGNHRFWGRLFLIMSLIRVLVYFRNLFVSFFLRYRKDQGCDELKMFDTG